MTVVDLLEFPAAWGRRRLGRSFVRKQTAYAPDWEPLSVFLNGGVVPRASRPENRNELGADLSAYLRVEPDDLVFNKLRTWQGGFGRSAHRGIVSPAYFVLQPLRGIASRFVDYLLHSPPYLAELARVSKWQPPSQFDTPWEHLRQVELVFPSEPEQRSIADFLDREGARLSRLQTLREQQIACLRAVFEAERDRVLAASVNMPLRYLAGARVGIVIQPAQLYDPDGTVPCLRAVNIVDEQVVSGELVRISSASHDRNLRSEVREGDVVVVRSGQAGMAAVVPAWADGGNCVDLLIIRPRPGVSPDYLAHALNSQAGREQIRFANVGAIQGHLNVASVKTLSVPRRALSEQEAVVRRLDAERARVDRLRPRLRESIARLAEYRDALITEAVTGQLDVTRLPEAQLDESAHAAAEGEAPEVLAG